MIYANKDNPFPGLRPFEYEDRAYFFGRENQILQLYQKLTLNRFVAVVGTSGSGKSSLVKAGLRGLFTDLEENAQDGHWHVIKLRPFGEPLRQLAKAIACVRYPEAGDEKRRDLAMDRAQSRLTRSRDAFSLLLDEFELGPRDKIIVIVDQFGELFRYQNIDEDTESSLADSAKKQKPKRPGSVDYSSEGTDGAGSKKWQGEYDERALFVNQLLAASKKSDRPYHIMLTMRSEFIGECASFRGLAEAINDSQFLTPQLTRDQRRDVVTEPIRISGREIAPALVQLLLNDSGHETDQLPVMQHALMRTWRTALPGRKLKIDHYNTIGGMKEAISEHADEVFDGLDDVQKSIAMQVFKSVTNIDRDGRTVRQPMKLSMLVTLIGLNQDAVVKVLDKFRAEECAFLLPAINTPLQPKMKIDITHEALFRKWKQLKIWVSEEAQDGRNYQRLQDATQKHLDNPKSLLGEFDAIDSVKWWKRVRPTMAWARKYPHPNPKVGVKEVKSIVFRSRDVANRSRLVLRMFRAFVFAGLMIFSVIAWYLWQSAEFERDHANIQRDKAQSALKIVDRTRSNIAKEMLSNGDAVTAALLSLESLPDLTSGRDDVPDPDVFKESSRMLRQALDEQIEETVVGTNISNYDRILLSSDREYLITEEFGYLDVWDVSTGKLAQQYGGGFKDVIDIQLLTGRSVVAILFHDGELMQWDYKTAKKVSTNSVFGQEIDLGRISADGRNGLLISNGKLHTFEQAAKNNSEQFSILDGAEQLQSGPDWNDGTKLNPYTYVELSSDGRFAVGTREDESIHILDVRSKKVVKSIDIKSNLSKRMWFSPDGKLIGITTDDGSLKIAKTETGEIIADEINLGERIQHVEFNRKDNRRVLLTMSNGTAKLWSIGSRMKEFAPRDSAISRAFFGDNIYAAITVSTDGTIRKWDFENDDIFDSAFDFWYTHSIGSSDGRYVAFFDGDKTFSVYEIDSTASLRPLTTRPKTTGQKQVDGFWISQGGKKIIASTEDHSLLLLDVAGEAPNQTLIGHDKNIVSVDFKFKEGADLILSASSDRTVNVWSFNRSIPLHIHTHDEPVLHAQFNKDGTLFQSVTSDGRIHVWKIGSNKPLRSSSTDNAMALSASITEDGKFVLTGHDDALVKLWDVETEKLLNSYDLEGDDAIDKLLFSHDASIFAAKDASNNIFVIDLKTGIELDHTVKHTVKGGFYGQYRSDLAFSPDGASLLFSGRNVIHQRRVYKSVQALVDYAKLTLPRCLTSYQRRSFNLQSEYPAFCSKQDIWPLNSAQYYLSEGRIALKRSNFGTAKTSFKEALSVDGVVKNDVAWEYINVLDNIINIGGNEVKIEKVFNDAISITPSQSDVIKQSYADALMRVQAVYVSDGEYGKAKILYDKVVEVSPNSRSKFRKQYAESVAKLAISLIEDEKYDQVRKVLDISVSISPKNADELRMFVVDAYIARAVANILSSENNYTEEELSAAIKLDPINGIHYISSFVEQLVEGTTIIGTVSDSVAEERFERVLILDPSAAEIISKKYSKSGFDLRGGLDGAKAFEKALEYDPRNASALRGFALIHSDRNEYTRAIKFIEQALEIEPKQAALHNTKGIILKRMYRLEDAYGSLSTAIELDDESAYFWIVRAAILRLQLKDEDARADEMRAQKLGRENVVLSVFKNIINLKVIAEADKRRDSLVAAVHFLRELRETEIVELKNGYDSENFVRFAADIANLFVVQNISRYDNAIATRCDTLSAHVYDPLRVVEQGLPFKDIRTEDALRACDTAISTNGELPRLLFQRSRVYARLYDMTAPVSDEKREEYLKREKVDLDKALAAHYPIAFNNKGYRYTYGDGVVGSREKGEILYQKFLGAIARCCITDAAANLLENESLYGREEADRAARSLLEIGKFFGDPNAFVLMADQLEAGNVAFTALNDESDAIILHDLLIAQRLFSNRVKSNVVRPFWESADTDRARVETLKSRIQNISNKFSAALIAEIKTQAAKYEAAPLASPYLILFSKND